MQPRNDCTNAPDVFYGLKITRRANHNTYMPNGSHHFGLSAFGYFFCCFSSFSSKMLPQRFVPADQTRRGPGPLCVASAATCFHTEAPRPGSRAPILCATHISKCMQNPGNFANCKIAKQKQLSVTYLNYIFSGTY